MKLKDRKKPVMMKSGKQHLGRRKGNSKVLEANRGEIQYEIP